MLNIALFILLLITACKNPIHSQQRARVSSEIIHDFVKKMEKKGLYAVGIGGAELHGKTTEIIVSFNVSQFLTVDVARCLIVNAISEILEITNVKPNANKYFDEFPISPKIFDIAIAGNSPQRGDMDHIVIVSASRGKIYYRTNNPNPAILMYYTVLEETFEEAQKIVDDQKNCSK